MGLAPKVVALIAASIFVIVYSFDIFGLFGTADLGLQREVNELRKALDRKSTEVRLLNDRLVEMGEQVSDYAMKAKRAEDAARAKPKSAGIPPAPPLQEVPKNGNFMLKDEDTPRLVSPAADEEDAKFEIGDEGNVPIARPRHDDERSFVHKLSKLKPIPDGIRDHDSLTSVRTGLQKYLDLQAGDAGSAVPVYGTACVDVGDCAYVRDQLLTLHGGPIRHIIIVMSGHHKPMDDIFVAMEKYFPGRVTIYRRSGQPPQGCAEAWNTILRTGFAMRPRPKWVWITNADLQITPSYLSKFARFNDENHGWVAANKYMHFSSFSITDYGWDQVGGFDEVIYPAYAEDVEFHIRCVSKGLFVDSYPENSRNTHKHVGSRSFATPGFRERWLRWDKPEYIVRKWGIRMYQYTDYAHCKPYRTPWNLPIAHNDSFVVDPVHRKCIVTGDGPKHEGKSRCDLAQCNSCYYNPSVLKVLLPEGETVPSTLIGNKHRI